MSDLNWRAGYLDQDSGLEMGTLNEVLGVAIKDDSDKLRGKRSSAMLFEEFGCHLRGTKILDSNYNEMPVEDVKVGDLISGDDGSVRNVLDTYSGLDKMYKITLSNGDFQIVNSRHLVYFKKYNWSKKTYSDHLLTPIELLSINGLGKGYYIPKSILKFEKRDVKINPYFLGLWLGDGDSSRIDISNEDSEVLE